MDKKFAISEEGTVRLNVEDINSMERRIIENNSIPKLVPMLLHQIDDWVTISYDLAGKTSLQKLQDANGSLTVETGVNILKNLLQEIKRLEEYMLLPANMVLKPEYIFVSGQLQKVEFVYVPYAAADSKNSIEGAVKGILAFIYQGIYMYPQNVVRSMKDVIDSQEFSLIKLQEVLDDYVSVKNVETYIPAEAVASEEIHEVPVSTRKEGKRKKERRKKEKKQVIKSTDEKKLRKNRLAVVIMAVLALILVIDFSKSLEISAGVGLILVMIVFIIWRRMGKATVPADETAKKAGMRESGSKDNNKDRASIDVFGGGQQAAKQQSSQPVKQPIRQHTPVAPAPQPSNESPWVQVPAKTSAPVITSAPVAPVKPQNQIILKSVQAERPVLFKIREDDFIIGKKLQSVDGLIDFNRTVSRRHCKVFCKAGEYFIEDLNSSNGTCLNGTRIEPGIAAAIKAGDNIRIANMDFVVKESER